MIRRPPRSPLFPDTTLFRSDRVVMIVEGALGPDRIPMRNRFDQLAKQLGREALGPSGTTIANDEISPETQQADLRHEPDPLRQHERARLGLLRRFAAIPCPIE